MLSGSEVLLQLQLIVTSLLLTLLLTKLLAVCSRNFVIIIFSFAYFLCVTHYNIWIYQPSSFTIRVYRFLAGLKQLLTLAAAFALVWERYLQLIRIPPMWTFVDVIRCHWYHKILLTFTTLKLQLVSFAFLFLTIYYFTVVIQILLLLAP